MSITRTNRNQSFDTNGNLVSEQVVEVDITEEVVEWDLNVKADQALNELRTLANATGSRTAAQLTGDMRVLARAAIVIIRLLLRHFDDVD